MIDDIAAVARALSYSRPGSRLIAYQAIGLPAYLLRLDLIAQRRKAVPAIEEFVLASVQAGIDQADQIASFLGLDSRLTERALVSQLGLGHLAYLLEGATRHLTLTQPGEDALRELSFVQPERIDSTVVFDRLRWRVVSGSGRALLAPKDVPWTCAKPARTREPNLDEIELDDVANAMAATLGQREARRDPDQDVQLLSVSGMHRQSRYLLAVALVFKHGRSSDCDLVIAVDSREDMDQTQAVIGAGARAQLRVEDAPGAATDSLKTATRGVRRGLASVMADRAEVDEVRSKLVALERILGGSDGAADATDEAAGVRSSEELRDDIAKLQRQLRDYPVRHVEPWEHTSILESALRNARERVLIVAEAAGSRTLNPQFTGLIEQACRRGVRCTVAYRQELVPPYQVDPAGRALGALADRNPRNLEVLRLDGEVQGCLVADDLWVASQFPWLSFRDDMALRVERGLAVTVTEDVDAAYAGSASTDVNGRRSGAAGERRKDASIPRRDPSPTQDSRALEARVRKLIAAGETPSVEFKSTLLWSVKGGVKDSKLQKMVTKTVAAFSNTRGGTLLIGVGPDGVPCGIELDCEILQQKGDTCVDAFSRSLATIVAEHLGTAIAAHIRIHYSVIDGKTVCVVDADPGREPVYLKADGSIDFYVRNGTTSTALAVPEIAGYIKTRWA